MRSCKWLFIALFGVALSSCSLFGGKEPTFQLSDLQALWQENNTEHFVRFTTEQSDEAGFLYGREWNIDEDVTEQDLLDAREELGHPGDGWFKYQFQTNGNLTEIHLMDISSNNEIPKAYYVVTVLTDTDLSYYDKETRDKFSFTKVVVHTN